MKNVSLCEEIVISLIHRSEAVPNIVFDSNKTIFILVKRLFSAMLFLVPDNCLLYSNHSEIFTTEEDPHKYPRYRHFGANIAQ